MPNLNFSLVYVSGPELIVEALGNDLKATGLSEAQLKQDFFPNYNESNCQKMDQAMHDKTDAYSHT